MFYTEAEELPAETQNVLGSFLTLQGVDVSMPGPVLTAQLCFLI